MQDDIIKLEAHKKTLLSENYGKFIGVKDSLDQVINSYQHPDHFLK